MFAHDAQRLQFTCRWAPVDLWTPSDLDSMKAAVQRLRDRIGPGQRWRLTIEKHRDARHHREEIIAALAALIPEKVDLAHPDRILCVDLLGDVAAMAVVTPAEVFSVARSRASR
jgi:tRNA(Ser,Leu) C12 N-acetylase TAN1